MTDTASTERVSDERLAEMLAGLEGVTPGPWKLFEVGNKPYLCPATSDGASLLTITREDDVEFAAIDEGADASHIGHCDPDTMRSILTEFQSLRSAANVGVKADFVASCPSCNGTGDQGGNPTYGECDDCEGTGKSLSAIPETEGGGAEGEDWQDDPSSDDRWNAGVNYAITQLCGIFGIDPKSISWDAATETLDGDVSSVLCNVLVAAYGEEWSSNERDTAAIRLVLTTSAIAPQTEGVGKPVAWLHEPTGNVFKDGEAQTLIAKWQKQFARSLSPEEIAADFTPLFTSPQPAAVSVADGWVMVLQELENACDALAETRSQETYLNMIDNDRASDALIRLDDARKAARAMLSAAPQPPQPVKVDEAWQPIDTADKSIAVDMQLPGVQRMLHSYPIWVRCEGRPPFEASWCQRKAESPEGYWWGWDGEDVVDPDEWMPHPLEAALSHEAEGEAN